jgi:catechol 2,3-dioxygenase-like lactoylglutathione lyase family enzyme
MIKTLAHVCLFSRDLERTRQFYCDGLGLSVQFRFMRQGELFGFYLKICHLVLNRNRFCGRASCPISKDT